MSLGTAPLHRSLKIALLVVVAASLTVLLSQCRMASDAVVAPGGVSAAEQGKNPNTCLRDCQNVFLAGQNAEIALHQANVKACKTDSLCLANEERRHEAAMAKLAADRSSCLNSCHHQGGGSGGR